MVSDPIADLLVRLKNAARRKHAVTTIPYSQLKEKILEILIQDGFVTAITRRGRKTNRRLEVALGYDGANEPRLHDAQRISRPGRRLYAKAREVRAPRYGRGVTVLSTPQGLMSHRDAKVKRAGGEVLFEIW
ncbi:MAG: 30S ribosomal protein S8 [bacterium]|nr:30S ribosomal protein S8 [bacterium]MDZ4295985.1 30S ribosomal protein S8 [Patescibacteria group bacterium]